MFKKRQKNQNNEIPQRSPLDEIRHAEANVASRILLARNEAEESIQNAKSQSKQIIQQAQDAGSTTGQEQYEAQVNKTRQEAQRLIDEALSHSKADKEDKQARIDKAVQWALNIVLGSEEKDFMP